MHNMKYNFRSSMITIRFSHFIQPKKNNTFLNKNKFGKYFNWLHPLV